MAFRLTEEQKEIARVFCLPQRPDMVVNAVAGAGKTSTLVKLGELLEKVRPEATAYYVTLNRRNAEEVRDKFQNQYGGRNVVARTMHSLAYRSMMGIAPEIMGKLNNEDRVSSETLAGKFVQDDFAYVSTLTGFDVVLTRERAYRLAMDVVEQFCNSADRSFSRKHVPLVQGVFSFSGTARDNKARDDFAAYILPIARRLWDDLNDECGVIPFGHGHYLKMWQLTDPVVGNPGDVIFYDEAQDAKPCIADIVLSQEHMQKVLVGDNFQSVYQFTGSVDSLRIFGALPGVTNLTLSRSFRFGEGVAEAANSVLLYGNTDPVRVHGAGQYDSRVYAYSDSDVNVVSGVDAVITRSNAELIDVVLRLAEAGVSFSAVVNTGLIKSICSDMDRLTSGKTPTKIPELKEVGTLDNLEDILRKEDAEGSQILEHSTVYRIVMNNGTSGVLRAMESSVPEQFADVVVSTMHKAKGREWDRVAVWWPSASRFPRRSSSRPVNEYGDLFTSGQMSELFLLYVAVTRGRERVFVPEHMARIVGMCVDNGARWESSWQILDMVDYVRSGGAVLPRRNGMNIPVPDTYDEVLSLVSPKPDAEEIMEVWSRVSSGVVGDDRRGVDDWTVGEVLEAM